MVEYKKLQKMIQSALRQSAEESSMLLGQDLEVADTEVLSCNKQKYLDDLDDSAFVVGVESREDYPGRFFMVFSLRDAIMMSGILLGIPPARISEKRKLLILEADDIDAFSEIANQIIGSLNSVFQPCLPQKVHLKQLPPSKYVPQVDKVTDELPFPEEDYVVYQAEIKLGGEELNRVDLLVPARLANLFDPQEESSVEEDAVHDQAESLRRMFPEDGTEVGDAEHGSVFCGTGTVLVLEDDPHDCEMLKQLLISKGYTAISAHLGADIREIFVEDGIQAVVLGTFKAEEWEFTLCSQLKDVSRNPSLPILMCAKQWTRTGVLKAVKNGARDIMLKPYAENEFLSKLGKILAAA